MEPMATEMDWTRTQVSDTSDDFVRRYREPVYRLALAITSRPDLAEDVAQDALLRGLTHRHKLADPLTWLRVVTVRRALTALKGTRMQKVTNEDEYSVDIAGNLAVRQTLHKLPADQQALLALSIGEGWSYSEIAGALSIPEGTVASRLHAAKEAFRKKWGNE
jgi:RNA polymerase sigma-70 factor, ECF subfamily